MKVDILDNDVFTGVNPLDLERFLVANNWREVRRDPDKVVVWERVTGRDVKRAWQPLDTRLSDYGAAVGKAVKAIAEAENRSQLDVVEDLHTVALGDVVRLATWDTLNKSSSTIPLLAADALILRSYRMAQAAALATLAATKREVYPAGRLPAQVDSYLKQLRLGQTEYGSYRIKLISPLRTLLLESAAELFGLEMGEPFERRVVINLMRGLNALERIASETAKRGRFYLKPFREIVPEGVSANLCEAIANVANEDLKAEPLEISVSWSYAVKPPVESMPNTVTFRPVTIPYIAQAAKEFRAVSPTIVRLTGIVTDLHRDELGAPGTITISFDEGEARRKVRLTLRGEDYDAAIRAHDHMLRVGVTGHLARRGHIQYLEDPTNFRIVPDEDRVQASQIQLL